MAVVVMMMMMMMMMVMMMMMTLFCHYEYIIVEHLLESLCHAVLLVFGAYLGLVLWLIITPESSVYKTLCLRKNYFTECLPKLNI